MILIANSDQIRALLENYTIHFWKSRTFLHTANNKLVFYYVLEDFVS